MDWRQECLWKMKMRVDNWRVIVWEILDGNTSCFSSSRVLPRLVIPMVLQGLVIQIVLPRLVLHRRVWSSLAFVWALGKKQHAPFTIYHLSFTFFHLPFVIFIALGCCTGICSSLSILCLSAWEQGNVFQTLLGLIWIDREKKERNYPFSLLLYISRCALHFKLEWNHLDPKRNLLNHKRWFSESYGF